ncbi:hypothetical protein MLD38_022363 [Melastoma candidum]|uniref:Uncharacterized protein n=1 Tax=Melastoma candidum TaxID=119954 RepID=A0ACB9QKV0_9MYRT|nr:hypothetical protein MLD38_022363 [Melastoma candidum]
MLHKSNLQFSIDGSRSSRVLVYVHPLAVLFSVTPLSWAVVSISIPSNLNQTFLLSKDSGTRLNSGLRRVDLLLKREMRDK